MNIVLKGYVDIDEFKVQIDKNWLKLNNKIYFKIYGEVCDFKLYCSSYKIELEKYIWYRDMIDKFKSGEECLDTLVKKYIENIK